MTQGQARKIIEALTLVGGKVEVEEGGTFRVRFLLNVQPRGESNIRQIAMVESIMLDHLVAMDEFMLLTRIQELWTSMWMHESLETIQYKGTIPFNPHCTTSIRPGRNIGYLQDGSCEPVTIKPQTRVLREAM